MNFTLIITSTNGMTSYYQKMRNMSNKDIKMLVAKVTRLKQESKKDEILMKSEVPVQYRAEKPNYLL
ncbi:MAG: hypothetical protein LKE46_14925 [Clostridium sp.]|uniref:hypothetical protein n=1 Tax=Clostridium sp. TaxID=1506 RepID=UPI0025C152FD|nr:hypothetical protein [Clostridium sp.]MCH3965529.1 hypothetical protein [Clostridium sp.]MCI1716858.1 hypothetical protein [Clostridium sp.]MCI1801212.1 hypothetical protein [Clostridium sp.]MCI1815044.1 hypothetical protein [Clostridium sp.]MCI1871945.1 hypothetical protein [Clostridium sp.]